MASPLPITFNKEQPLIKKADARLVIRRVVPEYPKRVYLQWDLINPVPGSHHFDIYRAGSSAGPWEEVATHLPDTFLFVDESFEYPLSDTRVNANLFALSRRFYYRVVATPPSPYATFEDIQETEGALDQRRRGLRKKLVRDARLYLKKVGGTEVAFFKRRTWGDRCPHCVDATGQITRAHCAYCYGTGFLEGYWTPVYGYAQRRTSPIQAKPGPQGIIEINRIEIIAPDLPLLEANDVLVFLRDDTRFNVESVLQTQIHSVTVHQELSVSELARSSREYNLKADNWHDPQWF